jgi:ABC-type transporter Mla MlaB component
MLKITRIDDQSASRTFKFEGQLREPWVAEALHVCTSHDAESGPTCLDLSSLTFVDQAGANLLKELIRRGIAISACSGFVAALLHLEHS